MNDKVNVLIFPSGSENAIDVYDSLKYNVHFNIFGASGKKDHSEFIYPENKFTLGELYIDDEEFLDNFNDILIENQIDYIIPTHDTIALYLLENQSALEAQIVCSPYETARVAENKLLTFTELRNYEFFPKIYNNIDEIEQFPVFLKPYVGAGGKGTYLVNTKQELEEILKHESNLLICEYLPGREYTIDCFTNKHGELLFVGPRTRERVTMGISFHSERVENVREFEKIAELLNKKFDFKGAWFFQVKEDSKNRLKLMEFSVRHAGTMTFYRQLGVNFAALSLFDAMGLDVKVLFNNYQLVLDRRIKNCYKFDYNFNKIFIDFDDTLIVNGKVNTTLMRLLYQCVNNKIKIVLLTKHEFDLDESLKKYKIPKELFDEIILIPLNDKKANYIDHHEAVFIDNHFPERLSVKEECGIPVFDVDAIQCLIDPTQI